MSETPSTDVIRHWVAWTYSPECPQEFIEHDSERLALFDSWLAGILQKERNRIADIVDKKTLHYGQTHYAGKDCRVCDIFTEIGVD